MSFTCLLTAGMVCATVFGCTLLVLLSLPASRLRGFLLRLAARGRARP